MINEIITAIIVMTWGLQHSILASKKIKEHFGVYPFGKMYRWMYIAVSVITLMVMELIIGLYLYPNGAVIEPIVSKMHPIIGDIARIIAIIGLVIAVGAFIQADPLVFIGLKDERKIVAKTNLFYRLSRHPIYLGILLVMIDTIMRVQNSVLLTEYLTLALYLIVGAKLEENRLKDSLKGYEKMSTRAFLLPYRKRHFVTILGRK